MNSYRDIVNLNLAALLRISGKCKNFYDAVEFAKNIPSVDLKKYL